MTNDQIIKLARTRMAEAIEADRENRARDKDDLDKLTGRGHWPDNIRQDREAAGKPCLTINRYPQFVRQVTGDIRRMNPAVKVSPSDNQASEEVAEIYEGMIRHIEQRSDASSVYERATEQAAASSIGWFRVFAEWKNETSFDQEIRIKRIRNSFSVYCDPTAQEPTREDAEYFFITETIGEEEHQELYPGKTISDIEHDPDADQVRHWREDGDVVVAEYIWKEYKTRELLLLEDGRTIFADEVQTPPQINPVRKRKVRDYKIMWAKISDSEVLEGPQELPCKYMPVIAVTGEEWDTGDEVYRSSVIRFAKDPGQLYNFMRSAEAEVVTLQPKAPYIGTIKQFQGLETHWQNANSSNFSYLPYNPDEKAPGPPQRQAPPVSSQGLAQQAAAAAEDMKATTGIYDAALGNRSNESSGVAIKQRQMESDVSTSIYSDNMAKAIKACGRVLISMIPRIYDTPRIVQILGEDNQPKDVMVNAQVETIEGMMPVNNLAAGDYEVRVSVGPNYSTRRQETQEGMLDFIRAVPGAAQIIGDLVAKAMDWPDAERIAERLKLALPPNLRGEEDMTPEEQQAAAMAMQEQREQQDIQRQAQAIEMQKNAAEAQEAEADAVKAGYEAEDQRFELMMKTGAAQDAIAMEVQRHLAAIMGQFQ